LAVFLEDLNEDSAWLDSAELKDKYCITHSPRKDDLDEVSDGLSKIDADNELNCPVANDYRDLATRPGEQVKNYVLENNYYS
jgi:hypothetical protein